MKWFSAVLVLLAVGCATAAPRIDRATTYKETSASYANGDIRLASALLMPDGSGRFPGAVIIQGSGRSDRTNYWARWVAEAMARRGIAVLLTDKRGSGASTGDWHKANFDDLASDAVAGVEYLRTLSNVDRRRVGVVGLSQGGFIAPFAAAKSRDVAFVVNVSGPATTVIEQNNLEMRNTFRDAGLTPEQVERGMKLQALAERYIRKNEWEPYETALKDALQSDLAPIAKGYPATQDSWAWDWWRAVGDYDPIVHWSVITQPSLVVYGDRDELENVPVKVSVERLRKATDGRDVDMTIHVYPGSGHGINEPGKKELRRDFSEELPRWIYAKSL